MKLLPKIGIAIAIVIVGTIAVSFKINSDRAQKIQEHKELIPALANCEVGQAMIGYYTSRQDFEELDKIESDCKKVDAFEDKWGERPTNFRRKR